jgi:hypothetical protein
MSTETIFFSYSREDSEFALTLAKNLRKAGANIWLDQLDIKPGTRWDKSVETALVESNTLLIVLSESSVKSTNVMDEVSFALDEKKIVVPVLLEECDIPFRLRRLQFADFTVDQSKGLKTLAEALNLEGNIANKLTDTALEKVIITQKEVEKGKKLKQELEIKRSETIDNTSEDSKNNEAENDTKKPKKRLPIYIGLSIIILLAIAYVMKDKIFVDEDKLAWELALKKDTISEYEIYKRLHPDGAYLSIATDSIYYKEYRQQEKIENDRLEAENNEWSKAISKNTITSYNAYLEKYANGLHSQKANDKIKGLEEDNAAWEAANNNATINVLTSYISNSNILGLHRDDALQKINDVGHEGWLFYGRINGTEVDNQVFDLSWRNGEEITSNLLPKSNDILTVKASYRTYHRLGETKAEGATGRSVKVGKKVLLIDTSEIGNALFVKVKHD